ncbi:cupredoxin domain-containing protein [Ferviditalea candida]|uniref:Cupredoxin domain-containing protein n=1 Tax=Ferviditalea candida TaxID=3108399 RepID=A0ABU5ZF07_9BACL|nr:cupredoxin domain-containing protein [Paenibacillaceae bacterium T2]
MKRIKLAMLGTAIIMALSACGSKEDSASNSDAASSADAANAKEIKLVATNFQYDQPEYHVKKGEPVKFVLELKQGAHGAEIKELGVNLDFNKKTQVVVPNQAGTFEIRCDIPCGPGHYNMVSKLIVEE